ncbi:MULTISPECIES: DinB family protein [Streptomycetaceae]|nr:MULTISPECIES: DinB family protein [Streptomycetaceae]MYS58156.1 DUF664 domain-containing protein [Streptomyces sp. SID5468]CCB73799.1 conserved protein of unknown function [Streptantibioticus cattleyicolor NRRL 8057 = DSM 46488]
MVVFVGEGPDERETLLTFVAEQRAALRRAALGLTEEQLRATPTASALSIGGLLKHNVDVERYWTVGVLDGRLPDVLPRESAHRPEAHRLADDETGAGVLAAYEAVARETERIVRALPGLEVAVTLPDRPWYPPGTTRTARWILLHLVQEAARHAGHADIVRETLDGKGSFELIAEETAAERG